jgi:hypothetical protein
MKKIIDFCILFCIYVTENYISHDWEVYKPYAKVIIYPFWIIRSILLWIISPIFIPEYFFKQSELYAEIQKIKNSPEFKKQMNIKFL